MAGSLEWYKHGTHLYLQEWDICVFTMDLTPHSLGRILYTSMKLQLQQGKHRRLLLLLLKCMRTNQEYDLNLSQLYKATTQCCGQTLQSLIRQNIWWKKTSQRRGDALCTSRFLYLKGSSKQYSHLKTKTSFKEVSCFSQRKMNIKVKQHYQKKLLEMN